MANPAVVVDFVANTKDLQKGFKDASGSASGFGSKLKGLATGAAVAGFAALTASLKVGVDEFAEAQKVAAQTGAALKSTGGVANVTAKEISGLAEALMKKSGVDDETIQSGENVLLTFTKIRNEAGKGNDVFNQATTAALDLSVALGKDMTSASTLVGKALNDPIKGIGALSKAGVQFTEAQKKQIEAMVATGDTLGAQKIILGELNTQFAGSAEAAGKTLPGQLNILKQEFSNLMGEIVTKVIPPLMTFLTLLNENRTTVMVIGGALITLTAAVLTYNAAVAAWAAIQGIATAATTAWAAAQTVLNFAMRAFPIIAIVTAVLALVAALVLAYKHSDSFRKMVDAAFGAAKAAATGAFNWIKKNWPLLLAILTGPIGLAVAKIIQNWDKIKNGASAAVDAVKKVWGGLDDFLRGVLKGVAELGLNVFKAPINAVISAWNNLRIPGFKISINMPKPLPDINFGWGGLDLPDIPKLAAGGIVTGPTLAMIGEAGPEAVIPLGGGGGAGGVHVRVFIGDTELRGLVRTEIVDSDTRTARTLLAGAR